MENNNISDQQIDDYIMGLLNEDENQSILLQLETNTELAEQVELRREIVSSLEAYGRKSFKEELKNIHNEVIGESVTETPAKRRSIFPYVAAAASILILMIAFAWFTGRDGAINTSDLYAANFEQYELSITQRDVAEETIIKMEQLYKNEKYAEVLPLLESQLAKLETKPSNLLLATGIAHLELNAPEEALSYFKQIAANGDFSYEFEIPWYSALAYLKSGDLESTKRELQLLVQNTKADHHEAAKELLKAITK